MIERKVCILNHQIERLQEIQLKRLFFLIKRRLQYLSQREDRKPFFLNAKEEEKEMKKQEKKSLVIPGISRFNKNFFTKMQRNEMSNVGRMRFTV